MALDLLVLLDNTLLEGFAFALIPLSCYLTFRLLDFPDVTVDGSFVLGGGVTAVLVTQAHLHPWLATVAAVPVGAAAGALTGMLYVRLGINKLLAGVLVAFGLYSVNLLIIGASMAFPADRTVLQPFSAFDRKCAMGFPAGTVFHPAQLAFFILVFVVVKLCIDMYLASESGLVLRASPHCGEIIRHKGLGPERYQVLGVSMANGVVALCGALVAQKEGAANSFRGAGMIIVGIAAFIVGEQIQTLCQRVCHSPGTGQRNVLSRWAQPILRPLAGMQPTMFAAMGATVYFLVVHLGYRLGLNPALPRLAMAVLLVAFLGDWRKALGPRLRFSE